MRGGAQAALVGKRMLWRAARRLVVESFLLVSDEGIIRGALAGAEAPAGLEDAIGTHAFRLLHPDDVPGAMALVAEAQGAPPGWRGATVVRLRDQAGHWCPFAALLTKRAGEQEATGYLVRILPAAREPAAVERAPGGEVALELESLAGAVPIPVLLLSPSGGIHYANGAAEGLLGRPASELRSLRLARLAGEEQDRLEDAIARLPQSPEPALLTFRLPPRSEEETGRLLEATLSTMRRAGAPQAIVVTLLDVTARHEETAELRRRATRDPLTGLLNRSSLEDTLSERLREDPERVALLYCDLDGFKAANDTFGHRTGDELLCEIARSLEQVARPGDVVGRHGGDEFALVGDVASPAETLSLVLGIEEAVAKAARERGLDVTASVGATTGRPGDTVVEMLHRADTAMYARKRERSLDGRTRALAGGARTNGWEFTERSHARDDEDTQL